MLDEINAKGLRRYSEAVAKGLIEPRIKPLTDALYESGAHPLASCEGHVLGVSRKGLGWIFPTFIRQSPPSKILSRPYVMFSAKQSYAKHFQCGIDHHVGTGAFFCNWSLRAHFVPGEYELVWMIELADTRLIDQRLDLKEAQQDISVLARIAREAAKK